jgi:hypothetical protein
VAGPEPPRLDATWLSAVLREHGLLRKASVRSLALEHLGSFTNEIWRVRPRYDIPEDGAPASLVLKSEDAARAREGEAFELEIRFYRELAELSPVRTPRFFGGSQATDRGRAQLLIEDVSGLQPFSFRRGASAAHARCGLAALAQLHAHWWEGVADLAWVPALSDVGLRGRWQEDFDRGWSAQRSWFAEAVPEFRAVGDALVGRLAASLAPLAEPATLLHGDAHAENLPLVAADGDAGEHVVFLDWPGPRRGQAGFDVAVFIAMSLSVEQRRRDERTLVALHADALREAGVDPPDPWLGYRRGILRRAARIVEIAHSFQRPLAAAALRMVIERCATAAADLDVGELII